MVLIVEYKTNKMKQSIELTKIWDFLCTRHVLSISTYTKSTIWSASLFYITDTKNQCLYIMSAENTRHSQMFLNNPFVSGTISDQTIKISEIVGLQFSGQVFLLKDEEEIKARKLYELHFPIATQFRERIWKICFTELKLTDNTAGFGTKYNWLSTK